MKTDVLVVGSGIAGLSFAIKLAGERKDISISVLSKTDTAVSNTAHAQGGMAVVLDMDKDSFEQHFEDTMKAGKGLNNREVVRMVVSQAPDRLAELLEWGTSFDSNSLGKFELGLEGGHSQPRIVHHRDLTGLEIQRKLLKKAAEFENIEFFDDFFVTDLLMDDENNRALGIKALDKLTGVEINIVSKITFLATGGSGMVFKNTTNPKVATADGLGMAYRAGAEITNMNYIQFHPTALYEEGKNPLFLISEAVRGFGAYIVNGKGNRFLFRSDVRGELATRDIVSRAIVEELKNSHEKSAFIDCRHLDYKTFKKEFPTIVSYCNSIGIDVRTDRIPVVPAAHYQCGGIVVDRQARTSIRNLYASGECADTGLHGANRLASNSLLEALVFSHEASVAVLSEIDDIAEPHLPQLKRSNNFRIEANDAIIESLRQRLSEIMTYDLLHCSKKQEKEEAIAMLSELEELLNFQEEFNTRTPAFYELRNLVQTALLVLEDALESSFLGKKIQGAF